MDKPKAPKKGKTPSPLDQEDQAQWDSYIGEFEPENLPAEEDFSILLEEFDGNSHDVLDEKDQKEQNSDKKADFSSLQGRKQSQPPQLDRRTEEKLRKGKMVIEARLDMHGMRQDEAYEALKNFVLKSANDGKRTLLVITGKGKSQSMSEDWLTPSKGILKTKVPQWLKQSPLQQVILKFTPAQPKDGGSGALYVYLKKNRNSD